MTRIYRLAFIYTICPIINVTKNHQNLGHFLDTLGTVILLYAKFDANEPENELKLQVILS